MNDCLITAYNPSDGAFVALLTATLETRGMPLYVDMRDRCDDDSVRMAAYAQAVGVIFVLTREYLDSPFGRAELAFAAERGLPAILIALRPLSPDLLPRSLKHQGLLDFSGWRDERRFQAQVERLITAVQMQTNVRLRPPPPTQRLLIDLIGRLEAQIPTIEFAPTSTLGTNPRLLNHTRPLPAISAVWGVNSRLRLSIPGDTAATHTQIPIAKLGAALTQVHRALLTGEAGVGKTTLLYRLALDCANLLLTDLETGAANPATPLPIVIDLAFCDPDQPLIEIVRALWRTYGLEGDPQDWLTTRRAILMLDGLDELGASAAARAAELRAWFTGPDAPDYAIVTCRSERAADLDIGVAQVECLPFDDAGMQRIVGISLTDHAADFASAVFDPSAALPEPMYRYPGHLLALLRLYKHEPAHDLPASLGKLHRRGLAALWKQRGDDSPRPSFADVSRGLSALALALLDSDAPLAITRAEASQWCGSDQLLEKAIRLGILETRGGKLRFVSRWLLDTCAALHLTAADIIPRLRRPDIHSRGQRSGTRYDGAFILAAGASSVPDVIVREITEVDPLLAGECLRSGVRVSASVRALIGDGLVGIAGGEPNEATAAATALAEVSRQMEANYTVLLDTCRAGTWHTRAQAVAALTMLPLRVTPRILTELRDWQWRQDDQTADRLRALGADALPLLFHLLNDSDWEIRQAAAWGLGTIADTAGMVPLVNLLSDGDPQVRTAAAYALGAFRDESLISPLLNALYDDFKYVRSAAAASLKPYAGTVLEQARLRLSDPSLVPEVQETLITLISEVGTAESAELLQPLVQSHDAGVRAAVARALGKLKAANTVPMLNVLLNDKTPIGLDGRWVCDEALDALKLIDTQEARQIVKAKTRQNTSDSELSLQRQRDQRVRELIAQLGESMDDPNPEVRQSALIKIAHQGNPDAIPYLVKAVTDEDLTVRRTAVMELVHFTASQDALGALSVGLRDDEIGDDAAQILAQSGERALPVLADALNDPSARVRAISAGALADFAQNGYLVGAAATDILKRLDVLHSDDEHIPFETLSVGQMAAEAAARIRARLYQVSPDDTASALSPSQYGNEGGYRVAGDSETEQLEALPNAVISGGDLQSTQPIAVAPSLPEMEPDPTNWTELPGLISALEHEDAHIYMPAYHSVRIGAKARAAQNIKTGRWVNLLIDALKSTNAVAQQAAMEALGTTGIVAAVPHIVPFLKHTNPLARRMAIAALSAIGDATGVQAVVPLLGDLDWGVRETACRCVSTHPQFVTPEAVALLEAILSSDDPHDLPLIEGALSALTKLDSANSVPLMLRFAAENNLYVRAALTKALAHFKHPASVDTLITFLDDKRVFTKKGKRIDQVAAQTLHALNIPHGVDALQRWFRQADNQS